MMSMRFPFFDEHVNVFYCPPMGGYYRRYYKNNIPQIPIGATHDMLLLGCIGFYIGKYTVAETENKDSVRFLT